ncbi:hypothetical protein E2C01_021636 [Portunus trituberculatus]|uniref:Uncharacterized protein n=1 Tax=Portunus trituberculatus TaxID=210409 RepID=A0A5B7E343_PORTR|nr:hypothetical protein [Portunus trituberculatus]
MAVCLAGTLVCWAPAGPDLFRTQILCSPGDAVLLSSASSGRTDSWMLCCPVSGGTSSQRFMSHCIDTQQLVTVTAVHILSTGVRRKVSSYQRSDRGDEDESLMRSGEN